ncbi:DNA maturase B [Sphaerotilus phage vB_SnaP-R1]|uniref:DNA maturase B n=1 Tax=Sphaerotilus phage vB_SnaP-R1 TaxID=2696336 RepID=A0A6B9SWR4_9CAUD|nr:DNA maturase B [Sphaerotilus phage vB_SnaP-R1]
MDVKARFAHAAILAEQYADFRDFAVDGMAFLGFNTTEIQEDIAAYMQNGPRLRMVMAQRGEAKSTLAALYAVWRIVQRPATRVLIVSAGEDQASEVATLVVRLIQTWDILECFRPDRMAGDRTSTSAFDVHYALKGLDKSPSVACVGITSNLPGKRADLLIPDDIESNKNGLSATQRAQLLHLSKEFSSICTHGDILYLGTPQSKDSIYNTLQGRGFEIRIWPGRYPTEEEEERYAGRLAPLIVQRMRANPELRKGGGIDGSRGQPTDPQRYNDAELIEKELDKGPEDFQLQYMLDTSLVDALRQQLRLSDLIVANFSPELLPEVVAWQAAAKYEVELGPDFPVTLAKMYYAAPTESHFVAPKDVFMYIDPAGGGADEIGIGVACALGPYIHVLDVAGLKGGLNEANEAEICDIVRRNKVSRIKVESNMGHGLFEINLRAVFNATKDLQHMAQSISGEYSTGQKEKRIIDSLVSPMQRHRVIVHQRVFESDRKYAKQHSIEARTGFSLWFQLANITTDRNSLPHDDRLEAVAGAVREFKHVLDQDAHKAAEKRQEAMQSEFLRDPMGYGNASSKYGSGTRRTVDRRSNRRR